MTPARQALVLVLHAVPAVHMTHWPVRSQTRPVPHDVPAGTVAPLTQVLVPPAQSVMPRRHGSLLPVHDAWLTHATQVPLEVQTRFWPHAVPAAAFKPSLHIGVAPHDCTPRLQGAPAFAVQMALLTQPTQLPAVQIRSAPHAVPDGAAGPSVHTAEPDSQRTMPVVQGAPVLVVQRAPSSHAMHWPIVVQTRPWPHEVPAGRWRVVSTHVAVSPHVVSPSTHGFGFALHDKPAEQVTQVPFRQAKPVPHETPFGPAGPSTHEVMAPSQRETPVLHGAPVLPVQG